MNITSYQRSARRKGLSMVLSVALAVLLIPFASFAWENTPPNNANTLANIFPSGSDHALALDIAEQIGQAGNIDYVPVDHSEFDDIEIVSMASSALENVYGLQYCGNMRTLSAPRNQIGDGALDVFPRFAALTHLNLSHNRLTSVGLPYLSGLPLKILTINDNGIAADHLETLPTSIVDLDLSNCRIGDDGAKKVARRLSGLTFLGVAGANIGNEGALAISTLTHLSELDLANNQIGDVGALALAKFPNPGMLSLDLRGNHISPIGMKALVDAGFQSLALDGQTVTVPAIRSGLAPIVHTVWFDPAHILADTISGQGVFSAAPGMTTGVITWTGRKSDATFTYAFRFQQYAGMVRVPYLYEPIVHTVTLDDQRGNITSVAVNDGEMLAFPDGPACAGGYVFFGWYYDNSGKRPFDPATRITEDITLYAGWTQNVEDSGSEGKGRKSYAVVSNLHVVTTNDESALRIYFSKVQNAKGYDIYRCDGKSKTYVKVKTLKGNGATSWVDAKLNRQALYRYKVLPYTLDGKKRKSMKSSYVVWALTASENRANATEVEVNQAKITGKKGDTVKLTATVKTVEGKQVLSRSIRWNSSDSKIASVDKNGRIKLLKNGKCFIWAKAHNGVNSRRVMIIVKKQGNAG
jgi:uncharacterized repeat protein (TIGR02543 family)